VQGICTDLPYGRASSSHDEGLAVLYDRALAAFHSLLPPTGYAVVGCAQPDLLRPAAHGLHVRERHAERVHRSLTRHYLVLQKDAV
jgi:tRNA (guanine10-N2)-dimethyltransferase